MDQKSTTVRRPPAQSQMQSTSLHTQAKTSTAVLAKGYTLYQVANAQIKRGTNAAQRGSLLRPQVVAGRAPFYPQYSASVGSSAQLVSPSKLFQTSPRVGIPHLPQSSGAARLPRSSSPRKSSLPSGRQVSASYLTETFTLSYTVECQRQGRKTSQIAFEIQMKGIPDVQASSTGPQLKALVIKHAIKDWHSATFGHPLHDDMCTLRDKSGVDLVDSFPDRPALRSQCMIRGAKGNEHFGFNKTLKVVLLLTPQAYETVEKYMDEYRSKESEDAVVPDATSPSHSPSSSNLPSPWALVDQYSQKAGVATSSVFDQGNTPATTATPGRPTSKRPFVTSPTQTVRSPPAKRVASHSVSKTRLDEAELPTLSLDSKLRAALQLHGQQQKPRVDASWSAIVHFFAISALSLEALMEEAEPLNLNDPTLASHANILYNPAFKDHDLGSGTFKRCHKGKIVIQPTPLFGLGSSDLDIVAIKRPYFIPPGKTTPTRLPSGDEIRFISQEATVWRFAVALLAMVYEYLRNHPKRQDLNQPAVPRIRFVQIGVAKCVSADSSRQGGPDGGFLVEEYIQAEHGFVRYIGNSSARPMIFHEDSYAFIVAQFCAFCQHVQWVLTEGKVYCSDWQ
ncbi:hypothetical protein FRC07_011031, partial [Ceratobasidium sp. 392]